MESKVCSTCKESKLLDEFYNASKAKDGKGYRCKSCDNLARIEYRKKHREKHLKWQRERNWKHKYGIDRVTFESMWESQKGCCAICSVGLTNVEIDNDSKNKSNTACIDHCHISGAVRGILCSRCNKGLGMFDDNIAHLLMCIQYLNSYSEIH